MWSSDPLVGFSAPGVSLCDRGASEIRLGSSACLRGPRLFLMGLSPGFKAMPWRSCSGKAFRLCIGLWNSMVLRVRRGADLLRFCFAVNGEVATKDSVPRCSAGDGTRRALR